MECHDIMHTIKTSLYADDLAATAIDFMIDKHMDLVPVVDRNEAFIGLLSGARLMHHLLPRSVSMMRGGKRAGFVRESRGEVRERLDELRLRPIGDLVDHNVAVAHPDTGLVDALVKISERQHVLPIIERDTKRLVGAISFFTVLNALT